MSPDDARHGSYAGAIAHWKADVPLCDPCRAAATRKRKQNELARISGRPAMVTLGEAAVKVIEQMPRNQLVVATGYRNERLRRYLLAGPTKRVHRSTRDRILAAGSTPTWTPVGVQRRLRALAVLGWSTRELADRAGMHATSLAHLRRRETLKHVRLNFAAQVVALYDDLCMSVPPVGSSATETRNHARAHGWLPPLAWNDIDDLDEVPDLGEQPAVRRGRRDLKPARIEDLEWLADCGETLRTAADRLGLTVEALHVTCRRADRDDLYWRLADREPDADLRRACSSTQRGAA